MSKNVYSIGLVMFALIMLVFFVINIFFRDVHYYRNSVMLSSFLLPFIFALGAFYSVTTYSRAKKIINFKEGFGRAFTPMFVAGLLSLGSIFSYINYADPSTKDLLNYQYVESYKSSLEEEYQSAKKVIKPESDKMKELEEKYQEGKIRIAEKLKKKEDMFSASNFGYVFAGYCAYFLLLSLFFGIFFRTKQSLQDPNLN